MSKAKFDLTLKRKRSDANSEEDGEQGTQALAETGSLSGEGNGDQDNLVDEMGSESSSSGTSDDENNDEEGEDRDIVDVDFEFYGFKNVDFHGTKSMLAKTFNDPTWTSSPALSNLTELIIAQSTLGSTVKCDGEDTDPYAICTLVNLNKQKGNSAVSSLLEFLASKAKSSSSVLESLILSQLKDAPATKVALLISERLINMPPQICPPMYKMLKDEIMDAGSNQIAFDSVLYVSKLYKEVEAQVTKDEDGDIVGIKCKQSQMKEKKGRNKKQKVDEATFYFNPEDELIARYATHRFDYKPYRLQASDSKNSFGEFGIDPSRRVFLIPTKKFFEFIDEVESFVGTV